MSGFRNQIQARVIIGGSTGAGLFLYNGNPGPGNTPILAAVAPGVTKDPYGNAVSSVLNIGTFTAAHISWDANGNTFINDTAGNKRVLITGGAGNVWPGGTDPAVVFYNSFGAIVLVVDPQRGGTFQYQDNNSAVQGVLIGAQVGKNTTDPVNGTAVNAGITLIDPVFADTLAIVGANINWNQVAFTRTANDNANTGSTNQGPFRGITAPEQTQAGHVVQRWYGISPDGTRAAGTVISTTDPPTRQTPALLEVQGDLNLTEIAAPAAVAAGPRAFGSNASGALRWTSDSAKGDSQIYDTGRRTLVKTGNQLINSTSQATIADLSTPVVAGTYAIDAYLSCTQGATAAGQRFGVSGPAASSALIAIEQYQESTTGEQIFADHLGAALGLLAASGAFGGGSVFRVHYHGIVTFSAAGVLALIAAEGTNLDTFTIAASSVMHVYPVG